MFDIHNDYLGLDFDGVIVDSIRECLVVGYNAFAEHLQSGRRINNLEELTSENVKRMRWLRNFIRSGEDYVFISLAIHDRAKILNQNDFDRFLKTNEHLKKEFFDLFYSERESFSKNRSQAWIGLNPLYPGMKLFLSQFESKERLFIITTKKIEYVNKILLENSIHLKKNNFFYVHGQQTKLSIINSLLKTHNASSSRFVFVDDQIDTLIKIKESGVQCFLARWGYTNQDQIAMASRTNIPSISLEDFLRLFSRP